MVESPSRVQAAPVGRALIALERTRRTGVAHLAARGTSLRVHLVEGGIARVEPERAADRFGEFLVRTQRLKRSQLELADRAMQETGQQTARTLVELGVAPPDALRSMLAEHARGLLTPLVLRPDATCRFEEAAPPGSDDPIARLSPLEVVLHAARRLPDPRAAWGSLGTPSPSVAWPEAPPPAAALEALNAGERLVLEQVRAHRGAPCPPAQIVEAGSMGEAETLRCLYTLVALELIRAVPPAPAASAKPAPPRPVGPPRSATAPAPAPAPPAADSSGDIGRYQVIKEIGRGAMGTVLLAQDPAIDRVVAIKLVQVASALDAAERERYMARFYQEARAAGKLLHPGIVTVFDVAYAGDGTPYIVMEYVEGTTLKSLLEAGALGLEEVVQIACEILDALAYAHARGVVHRDVKPANILVTLEGKVKIMDFGVAHMAGSQLTQREEVMGTPSYMAPEQLSGGQVDGRADLFSFGVVLYEMATGERPFKGDSVFAIVQAVASQEPVPAYRANPRVPSPMSNLIARCLLKPASKRPATAEAVRHELLAVAPQGEAASEIVVVESGGESTLVESKPAAAPPRPSPPPARPPAPPPRPAPVAVAAAGAADLLARLPPFLQDRRRLALAGIGVLVVAGLLVALLGGGSDDGDTSAAGSAVAPPTTLAHASPAGAALPAVGDPGAEPVPTATPPPAVEATPDASATPEPTAEATPEPTPEPLTDGELFAYAREAHAAGDHAAALADLQTLLARTPGYPNAALLLAQVEDALWAETALPMAFRVRHDHRLGSCEGELTLADWGMSFRSPEHEAGNWRWRDLESLERRGLAELRVRAAGRNYTFELLDRALPQEDWERYQKLRR